MTLRDYLRTSDLAQAGEISVQQIRNYEAIGLLPAAERSKSGYRLYTQQHLAALKTVKAMVSGYNWQRTTMIMQAIHREELSVALALIDIRHAELASKRLQAEQTLAALQTLTNQPTTRHETHHSHRFRIGEAAKQVDVRVSAIHFWEQQDLVHPIRDKNSHYRIYDEQQMHRLRIIVLLRDAGYNFTVIASVLDEMVAGRPQKALLAVQKRFDDLKRTSWACLEALALFQHYVHEFWAQLL